MNASVKFVSDQIRSEGSREQCNVDATALSPRPGDLKRLLKSSRQRLDRDSGGEVSRVLAELLDEELG